MSAGEPDNIPVRPDHVRDFLAWYRKRVNARDIELSPEWWNNALKTLTLGELRNGIRALQRFDSKLAVSPVEFWGLCKGKQNQNSIERFRQLRETVRKTPPIPKPKKETRGDDHGRTTRATTQRAGR